MTGAPHPPAAPVPPTPSGSPGIEREDDALRARLLGEYLEAIDAACPGCGYNLRRLTGTTCPECAQRLTLAVELVHPRFASFLFGLLGLAVGVGFQGVVGVWAVWMSVSDPNLGVPLSEMWTLGLGLVVEGAAMVAWIGWRGRVRRQPSAMRWGLGALAWGASIAFSAMFFAVVG